MQSYLLPSHINQNSPFPINQNTLSGKPTSVLSGKRAVVVEDEGVMQMQLRRILKNAGVVVVASAINGEQGVEAILRDRPDFVLMDIQMPGAFDGLEAARRVLAEYTVCVVMLTAFSDQAYKRRAEEIRVGGYIVKPITAESLIPQLEDAVRNFDSR